MYFEGNFPSTSPPPPGGGLYLEGLIHGGAYFRNFTISKRKTKRSVLNLRQNCSKNKLVGENAVTRVRGSCSLRVYKYFCDFCVVLSVDSKIYKMSASPQQQANE